MSLFKFLSFKKRIPDGFVDYDAAAIASAFDLHANIAEQVENEYHQFLAGSKYFASSVASADLQALSHAVASHFHTSSSQSVAIARWFSQVAGVKAGRQQARTLGIKKKIWRSACQYGSPDGNPQHISYEGQTFFADRGLWINGSYLLPGAEIGCKCVGRSLIPGFDDE